MSPQVSLLSLILVFTHLCFQMNLALQLREVLVMSSQSIEFDLGHYTFVVADESGVVAKRSTGHQKLVY